MRLVRGEVGVLRWESVRVPMVTLAFDTLLSSTLIEVFEAYVYH